MSTLTNRTIRSTYGQLIQLEDTLFQDGFGTGSLSGSYELTGSQFISGTLHVTGNLEVTGTASIGYLETIYETSSIIYSSGSTKFGDDTSDTHEITGSLTISGSAFSTNWSGSFTGSFIGLADSASNAERAVSASQADSATTSSHALASSNINVTPEESSGAGHYLLFAQSNTGETQVKTDSGLTYIPQTDTISVTKVIGQLEGSASYAETASLLLGSVENAVNAQTASLAISTSFVVETSTSFAASGDGPFTGSFSSSLYSLLSGSFTGSYTGSLTGSLIGTASIADFSTTASHALSIQSGLTSSRATSASIADELSQLATASFADTATLSRGGSGSFSGSFQGDGSNLSGIATTLTVDGDSGTQDVDLQTDDLQILGTANEIVTAITKAGNDVRATISLPDDVTIGQDLTVTRDATITRNLTVQGTASFQHTTDLDVADRFIRLASGSNAAGDGGIAVIQSGSKNSEALAYDSAVTRWGFTGSFDPAQNTIIPEAFIAAVIEGGSGDNNPTDTIAKYAKKGNIFVADNGEIYVYSS